MEQAYQSNNSPQNTRYWRSSNHGFGKTLNNAVTWISSLVSAKNLQLYTITKNSAH